MKKSMRLGDILVQKKLANAEQIEEAVRIQVGGNRRIGYILIKMGVISDDQLMDVLSDQLDVPIIKIDNEFSPDVKKLIPRYLCQKYTVAPIAKGHNNILNLAMVDPSDDDAIADIESYTGLVVMPMLARETDISSAIKKYIPFSVRDFFNPQVYSRATRVTSFIALVLLVVIGVASYQYMKTEKYGTISVIGHTQTFKNHDLIVGVDGKGKISLLGHGAYAKGFYYVTFSSSKSLQSFLEQKKKNFSEKQYDWLNWVIVNHLSTKKNGRS